MTDILCIAVLPSTTGLPEDAIENSFAFHDDVLLPLILAANAQTSLEQFYATGASPVGPLLSAFVSRGLLAARVDAYNITGFLNGAPHGSRISTFPFTVPAGAADSGLPEEVAVALSFHGDLTGLVEEVGVTRPRARRRGRVFIGPLKRNNIAIDASNRARVTTTTRTTVKDAASELLTNAPSWCVWSRANAALYPVVGGWVDDAFDTIRKRGPAPTLRDLWS